MIGLFVAIISMLASFLLTSLYFLFVRIDLVGLFFSTWYITNIFTTKFSSGKAIFFLNLVASLLVVFLYKIIIKILEEIFPRILTLLHFLIALLGTAITYLFLGILFAGDKIIFGFQLLNNNLANIIINVVIIFLLSLIPFFIRINRVSEILEDKKIEKEIDKEIEKEIIYNELREKQKLQQKFEEFAEFYSFFKAKEAEKAEEENNKNSYTSYKSSEENELKEALAAFYLDDLNFTLTELKTIRNRLIKSCHSDNNNDDELSKKQSQKINLYFDILKKYAKKEDKN